MCEIFGLDGGWGVGCLWWIHDPQTQTLKLDLFPFGLLKHKGFLKRKILGPSFHIRGPGSLGAFFGQGGCLI